MKCPYCGKTISEDAKFCEGCGSPIAPAAATLQATAENTQATNFTDYLQVFKKSGLILRICWTITLLVTLGLAYILSALLKLHASVGNQSLDSIGNLLKDFIGIVSAMQVITNISMVLIIVEIIILAVCMYMNRERLKQKLSVFLYLLSGIQLIYIFSNISQINGMAKVMNNLKSGDLGSLIAGYATGEFSSFNYLKTGHIVFVIVCFIAMAVCVILSGLLLFANKNITVGGIVEASKKRTFRIAGICVGAVVVVGILAGVGVYIYSTFIYKNDVNVLDGVSISYSTDNFSGESTAQVSVNRTNDKQKNNIEVQDFLKSVKYNLNKKDKVANGDTLTVQAVVDPSVVKKDRIKVVGNLSKSVKVKGLKAYVISINQLTKDDIQQLTDLAKNQISQKYTDSFYQGTTVAFDSLYYKSESDFRQRNVLTLDFTFKVHEVETFGFGTPYTYDFEDGTSVNDLVMDGSGKLDMSNVQFDYGGENTDNGFTKYAQ